MKKFFKIMGIITGALFVCGIFFVIIGVLSGGLNHTYKNNKWFNIVINPTVEEQEYYLLEDFEAMNLDISTANIQIKKGDEFAIEYALYGNVRCEVVDNTLIIEEKSDFAYIGLSFKTEDTYINIYIPENVTVDIDNLCADMGNIDISDITFKNMNVEANMGNIYIKNVSGEAINLSADMGNIEIDGEIDGKIYADTDMGDITLGGNLACDVEIESDMGNVDIETIYDMKMYQYSIDVDLGTQKVYQNDGEILEKKNFVWEINSDMGDVTLTFGGK